MTSIWSLVEKLAQTFAEGDNKVEAVRAREEYFELTGRVFDDDGDLFESRMAAFLEWYIIERGFAGGPPPAARVIADAARFSDEDRAGAVHLLTSHRGLFELAKADKGLLEVDDLLGGGRFSVVERRNTIGFEPGALFEARLMWEGQAVVFGKTFLFHPAEARDAILKLVDDAVAANEAANDLLARLSRTYIRWHRYNHLSAARVYSGKEA